MTVAKLKEQPRTNGKTAVAESLSCYIEYQPELVEQAVLRAISGHSSESLFRRRRDEIYTLPEEETREYTFQNLHQEWFERLKLDKPVRDALNAWPILTEHAHRCLLMKARARKEIGAELFVAEDPDGNSAREIHSIIIQLTPELFSRIESLVQFLHRELLHIVDMLNPEFGYEPHLPKSDIGPTYDRLLQDRYRVLWDIVVDGRLIQSGCLPRSLEENDWTNFKNAFPGSAQDLRKVFDFFISTATPRHQELVSFALSPETWLANNDARSNSKGICPLCRFPSFDLKDVAANLYPSVVNEIKTEHPDWNPARPICQQCIDLYDLKHSRQA